MKKMLAMFLALMTVLCFGTAGLAEEPIKLGSLVGITAPDPSIALAMDRGFQLAVEEVNAAGGIAGRQLEYISYDVGAWDTREAINGYTYLADEEGCVAIMGCPVSDIGLALIDYAADYQVPLVGLWINVACTHDENDVPYPYMYLAQPTNNDMAEIVAAYMLANGRDKVAILYNQQQSYHTSQVSSFSAYFTAHGGEIVTEQTFTSDTMDFSTILTMIKETGVNSLYYPMDSTTGVNVLSTLDGLGMMTGDFAVFGDVNYSAPFTDMLPNKDVANRIFFPLNVNSSDDKLIGLATDYLSKYDDCETQTDINVKYYLGYDIANVIVDAIRKCVEQGLEINGVNVNTCLEQVDYQGITGRIPFSPTSHQSTHDSCTLYMYEIVNGEYVCHGAFEYDK